MAFSVERRFETARLEGEAQIYDSVCLSVAASADRADCSLALPISAASTSSEHCGICSFHELIKKIFFLMKVRTSDLS